MEILRDIDGWRYVRDPLDGVEGWMAQQLFSGKRYAITAKLPFDSSLNSNLQILLNNKKPIIEYKVNFSSANAKKFLRKLSIYDFSQKKANWYSEGVIDIKNRKINIKKLLKDQVRITNKNQIKILEDSFNKNVIDDDIVDIFDAFKVKKFLKEIY